MKSNIFDEFKVSYCLHVFQIIIELITYICNLLDIT